MEPLNPKITIMFIVIYSAFAYEISKYTNDVQDIDIFCRFHTLQYEVELKGINEIKNKIATSIELLTQICNNVKFNHICLFMMTEIRTLYTKLNEQNKSFKSRKYKQKNKKLIKF